MLVLCPTAGFLCKNWIFTIFELNFSFPIQTGPKIGQVHVLNLRRWKELTADIAKSCTTDQNATSGDATKESKEVAGAHGKCA